MIINGHVRFGGGPLGKGPSTVEPRPTAYPAKIEDQETLGQILATGPVPGHETVVRVPRRMAEILAEACR